MFFMRRVLNDWYSPFFHLFLELWDESLMFRQALRQIVCGFNVSGLFICSMTRFAAAIPICFLTKNPLFVFQTKDFSVSWFLSC